MLRYAAVFFLGLVLIFSSCNKEIEVTPANIYGKWSHYYESDNYFLGMHFHENGDFQYLERFAYEKEFKERSGGEGKLTYKLEDKTVSLYRLKEGEREPTFIRSFKIKYLTQARLTEDDNFVWRREQ